MVQLGEQSLLVFQRELLRSSSREHDEGCMALGALGSHLMTEEAQAQP